jgi:antitoxin (DNA-binding transcriptional repressor) of toxin-antitoxin stability system
VKTIRANDVRIPEAAREALARHEEVVVLNRDRPVYVIVAPEDHLRSSAPRRRGRPLREALAVLSGAPLPDEAFADDLEAVRETVGPLPGEPWERS